MAPRARIRTHIRRPPLCAFALGAQSLDAAVLVYLDPGAYTA
jgi:hypothetical protein